MGNGEMFRCPAQLDTSCFKGIQHRLELVFPAHVQEGIIIVEDSHLHNALDGLDQCGIDVRIINLINRQGEGQPYSS